MRDNRGVTFVELIVCVGILSFVLVAIVGMLSSNTNVFRKQKANITVQDDAREIIDHVTDLISQAEYVKITCYKIDSIDDGHGTITTQAMPIKFDPKTPGVIGKNDDGTAGSIKGYITHPIIKKDASGTFEYKFTDIKYSDLIYAKEIEIQYSVPFEKKKPDGTSRTLPAGLDPDKVTTDTCTVRLQFEHKDNLGIMMESIDYKYMKDLKTPSCSVNKPCTYYSDNLNFIMNGSYSIEDVLLSVDAKNQSIKVKMGFTDKGIGYDVEGMANIKNKSILVD